MATLNNVNVVKANRRIRRSVLCFLLGVTGVSWLGIYFSRTIHQTNPTHPLLNILGTGLILIAAMIAVGLLGFGLWMGRVSVASLRQGCYPPYNSTVMCDTLLVTGWQAYIKALCAFMLAVASILGTIGISLEIVELIKL